MFSLLTFLFACCNCSLGHSRAFFRRNLLFGFDLTNRVVSLGVAGVEALRAVCLQTFLGGFQLRETTPFLLDQEIFGAADLLGRAQNALPIRDSFPEEDRISFAWVGGPPFTIHS